MLEKLKAVIMQDYSETTIAVQLLTALKNRNTEMLQKLIKQGVDFKYRPCPCTNVDCPSPSILQALVKARDFATIQYFSDVLPTSPVDLAENVDTLNHSVAWILVKNKQFSLLQELVAVSKDAVINFSEKHNNLTLLDLLAELQQWDVIKTLIYANMARDIVQPIKTGKSFLKNAPKDIKEEIELQINVNNKLANNDRSINNTSNKVELKSETKPAVLVTNPNVNAKSEVNNQNETKEVKLQNIVIPSVIQLFEAQIIACLTDGKQIFLTLEGSDIEKMTTLRKLFKSMNNSKVTGSNNVIEIEVKNQKILEDFLRSKYQLISNILNPKSTPDNTITFVDEITRHEIEPITTSVNTKSKKPDKYSVIDKKIKDRQKEREATKQLQQDKKKSASQKQLTKKNAATHVNNRSVEKVATAPIQKEDNSKLNPNSKVFKPNNNPIIIANAEEKKPQAQEAKETEKVEPSVSKPVMKKSPIADELIYLEKFTSSFFKAAPKDHPIVQAIDKLELNSKNEESSDDEEGVFYLPPDLDLNLDSEDYEPAFYQLPKLW